MKILRYSKDQPNNEEAWQISECMRNARPGGDPIDHGLSFMQQLEAKGYGIVKLDKPVMQEPSGVVVPMRCQMCIDRSDPVYGSWAADCPIHKDKNS